MERLIEWIKRLFGSLGAGVSLGVRMAAPYVGEIYQLVRRAAELTPTRMDDEIFALCDELGVPRLLRLPASGEDRGPVIADIIVAAAKKRWPNAPERRIRRAIEMAYGALRP
jgi:hypothetical protein